MRMRLLIAGMLAAALVGGAMAAERVSMIGTAVSLVPPDGFGESAETQGLTNEAGGRIEAFPMPAGYLFDEGLDADDTLAPFFRIEGFADAGEAEAREANGRSVFLQETTRDGESIWVAVFNSDPGAAVTFKGLDGEAVRAVLDTVKLAPTGEVAGGAHIRGLFLPLVLPFADVDVSGLNEAGTLSLTEEKSRKRTTPHIDLFYPRMTPGLLALRDQGLEALANSQLDIKVDDGGSSVPAMLLGVPAVRQQGRYRIGSREGISVGYLGMMQGQAIVLILRGPEETMTPDVIAAVDAVAAGLQRYIPE